jgi:ubiquinone/menaquinone biosynthesis C-methylase UbiE
MTDIVRRGYDELSYLYRADDDRPPLYMSWLAALNDRLPGPADVLDLGCGCGVPVSASLAAAGHRVTGVDFSEVQISRARTLVPAATFIQADATAVSFPDDSFDAVVCLYMLIHLPLADQPTVIARIARWLRPGGKLLVTTGATAWTGTEDDWLGGTAPMWWSHPDADTYRSWLVEAGLHVDSSEFVPEGAGGHQLFWCSL